MVGSVLYKGTATRWIERYLEVRRDEIRGCSEDQIAEVCRHAHSALPAAYQQWLREAGISIGSGTIADHFERFFLEYPKNLKNSEFALEIITDLGKDADVLQRYFPFCSWEMNVFLLDLGSKVDDPPICRLDDQDGSVKQYFPSFSQFIAWEIFLLSDSLSMSRSAGLEGGTS